jgi:hypothetical protein
MYRVRHGVPAPLPELLVRKYALLSGPLAMALSQSLFTSSGRGSGLQRAAASALRYICASEALVFCHRNGATTRPPRFHLVATLPITDYGFPWLEIVAVVPSNLVRWIVKGSL